MKETLNKSVYLKHGEVLIILGLIESRIEELRERGEWNLVEQFMLDIVFMDIVKKLDPHNQENIKGLITKPTEPSVQMVNGVMSNITLEEIEENNAHNLKIINKEVPETVTGVLTTPSKEPRPIAELVMELWGHPEYVGGRIFTKDDIMDTIIYDLNADNDLYEEGEEEYMTDDEIADKAEELYKLNGRSISNAIDDICNDAFDGVDFTDYMTYDLSKKEIE
jgi:hypothetical protein